jgi:hypothetical protein
MTQEADSIGDDDAMLLMRKTADSVVGVSVPSFQVMSIPADVEV